MSRIGRSVFVAGLALLLVGVAFCCSTVALRPLNIGTDTQAYANFFYHVDKYGIVNTRLEPGYVAFARIVSYLGFDLVGMQALTFLLLITIIVYSATEYWKYLGSFNSKLMFLTASFGFFFLSPMFVNASINAIRQGLASLLIFTALLSFSRRQWLKFAVLSFAAIGFHYSSVIYIVFSPMLLLRQRGLHLVFVFFFILYCLGLTEEMVKFVSPFVYSQVMDYKYGSQYNAGVRLDFAFFSIFWYIIASFSLFFVRKSVKEKLVVTISIYLTMLLPFFLVGFGNYSNRLLVPAWLSLSLLFGAIIYNCRVVIFRHPVYLWMFLCFSSVVFNYFVINEIII
ncbi:EpsG family protein [Desulfuromonas versatilis]|uniref:EpsG family protein n=1 Tax=Desulfuromonas versatilis TaxID=2802975 RepID=UPI001C84A850|nr:EpsG family protein [Desulfuromonas versatilis]